MPGDDALHARLLALARGRRVLVVTGLPGTGKSLVIHQLAHLAAAAGRSVHLLQWDVARPVFEATPAGRRYPVLDGVTHVLIRTAVGLWARRAVAAWDRRHTGPAHVLVAEAPFVGGRLIELARPADDAAEPLLASDACRFVLPVPSARVRRFVESERARRATDPLHPREREDAPPQVLRDLWRELAGVARRLGLARDTREDAPYDAGVYRAVYEALLRRRRVEVVELDTVLPTHALSVYDFAVAPAELVPAAEEAEAAIREAEARHPDAAALAADAEGWWKDAAG